MRRRMQKVDCSHDQDPLRGFGSGVLSHATLEDRKALLAARTEEAMKRNHKKGARVCPSRSESGFGKVL